VEEDVKPKIEAVEIKVDEAELAGIKAKEEEARITAELPKLAIPFGGSQWETDVSVDRKHEVLTLIIQLDGYYTRSQLLQQNIDRAKSAQRIAGAVLADAEAEMVAATERGRITEEQLAKATSLGVGIALI
jgi:hypothetical protein